MDRETGKPCGFAFVTLASKEEVDHAMGQLHNSVYDYL